jgi:hypothetical protein
MMEDRQTIIQVILPEDLKYMTTARIKSVSAIEQNKNQNPRFVITLPFSIYDCQLLVNSSQVTQVNAACSETSVYMGQVRDMTIANLTERTLIIAAENGTF